MTTVTMTGAEYLALIASASRDSGSPWSRLRREGMAVAKEDMQFLLDAAEVLKETGKNQALASQVYELATELKIQLGEGDAE